MEPLILGVHASDDRLPDHYDSLASRLDGRGCVYVPHVVIPLNARVPVERPPRLIIGLTSPADVGEVAAWAAEYLAGGEAAEMHVERAGREVVLRADDPMAGQESLRGLVSG
jgi:hypothetical protein